jgi:hypothetical protein
MGWENSGEHAAPETARFAQIIDAAPHYSLPVLGWWRFTLTFERVTL